MGFTYSLSLVKKSERFAFISLHLIRKIETIVDFQVVS